MVLVACWSACAAWRRCGGGGRQLPATTTAAAPTCHDGSLTTLDTRPCRSPSRSGVTIVEAATARTQGRHRHGQRVTSSRLSFQAATRSPRDRSTVAASTVGIGPPPSASATSATGSGLGRESRSAAARPIATSRRTASRMASRTCWPVRSASSATPVDRSPPCRLTATGAHRAGRRQLRGRQANGAGQVGRRRERRSRPATRRRGCTIDRRPSAQRRHRALPLVVASAPAASACRLQLNRQCIAAQSGIPDGRRPHAPAASVQLSAPRRAASVNAPTGDCHDHAAVASATCDRNPSPTRASAQSTDRLRRGTARRRTAAASPSTSATLHRHARSCSDLRVRLDGRTSARP